MRKSVLILFATLCLSTQLADADEKAAIAAIEELGGSVRVIAMDSQNVEAAFHLADKDVTDAALVHLQQIPNLVWLNLKGTKITDEGLKQLADVKTLTRLHLETTGIGDAGVQHLSGLENLEYLNLYGTKVSDEGLKHLEGLKSLKKLYLWQSQATQEGADKLKESLPELMVNLGSELKVVKVEPAAEQKPEEAKPEEKPAEPPKKTLAKGQFVKVRLTGENRILSLAEVLVLETNSGKPLQVDGTATQSSVDYDGEPKRGSDGKTDQDYNNGSVTHTKAEKDPWWQIDLGGVKDIGLVKVYNRSDCCGDRLKDAIVEILDAEDKIVFSEAIAEATDGSVKEFVGK